MNRQIDHTNSNKIRIGIIGVSGYSGFTALDLLLNHPDIRLSYVAANNTLGPLTEIWPALQGRTNLICQKYDSSKASELCDAVFLAVPHKTAMSIVPNLLNSGLRIIDLSADYRLKSALLYKKTYSIDHTDQKNLRNSIYGLPELYRPLIKKARLIANPGCYPTAAILALAPIWSTHAANINSIIIDAKSGTSGAGKKMNDGLMFCEVNENFKAYKVLNHQHEPEIKYYLSRIAKQNLELSFVPHLLPIQRGILETIYIKLKNNLSLNYLHSFYKKFYKNEPFVRILPLGQQVELKNVNHTNYCDISLAYSKKQSLFVITCTIDNLLKGAAGQAVQNMNIMFGFPEKTALL